FHRRHVDAESPDEAARLVVDGADLLRSAIDEVWVELGDSWMVYDREGKQVRQQSKERNGASRQPRLLQRREAAPSGRAPHARSVLRTRDRCPRRDLAQPCELDAR